MVLNATNTNLEKEEKEKITVSELFRFIGIWFFMATMSGFPRGSFWAVMPVDNFDGAPNRFQSWMSWRRFEDIRSNLGYTCNPRPTYQDKFWEVRELIENGMTT